MAIVVGGGLNSYNAGLVAALTRVRLLPVASFGGAGQVLWQQISQQSNLAAGKLPEPEIWDRLAGNPSDAIDAVLTEVNSLPRLMIVHGRSKVDRDSLIDVLGRMRVTNPIVLQQTFSVGSTVLEKFERDANRADGAIALFTPDDNAASLLDADGQPVEESSLRSRARARQNVSLEYGWFWGRLGRDRILLLLRGGLELPSDLRGLSYEAYEKDPTECEGAISKFVNRIRGA